MKIGLLGLPNSGKTTIFNALTKSEAEVTTYASNKAEPNAAIVEVGDERIIRLSHMYKPKKTTYATIEMVDFVGFSEGTAREEDFSNAQMSLIKNMDALALVVRNFTDDLMENPNPIADIETIDSELILSDMIGTENRIERIEWNFKRGKSTNKLQFEERILRKIQKELNNSRHVSELSFNSEEEKVISGFQFVTKKPFFVILNSSEENFGSDNELIAKIEEKYKIIEFAGKFEMELSHLCDEKEASLFMEDIGIKESARDRITRFAYEMLGYISFITVGTDEVRAWTIHDGNTALEAAETIHSDLARGFIRAECFSYNELIDCGSEKGVRDKGRFRLEGKDYIIKDGDILNIRFNV